MNKKLAKSGYPESERIKAGTRNIKYHLDYIGWLMDHRRWLAGDMMTIADFAAAAHLSCLDYVGDVDWSRNQGLHEWYAKIKSRPAFRSILADLVPGFTPAAALCGPRLLSRTRTAARRAAEGAGARGGLQRLRHLRARRDSARRRVGCAAFVAAGWHGRMGWMAERMGWRGSPAALWPEARSVVMLAEIYTPEEDPLAVLARRDRGAISVYARGRDYHDIVKRRLKRLGRWLVAETGAEIKVFVDTAPVMEKPLAQAAGLGWQGKHTNLVSRELGSWFFLGAIFTTLDLPRDGAEADHCGSCRACLDVCPTRAFPAPYRLDARRCISYLTIEHDGPVDEALRPLHRQPHLRLRRLPRGLPVEQVRRRGAGHRLPGAGGARRARAGAARRPRRRRVPRLLQRLADQAHRTGALRPQRALRHRQLRATRGCGRPRPGSRTMPIRWCGTRRRGRWRGSKRRTGRRRARVLRAGT